MCRETNAAGMGVASLVVVEPARVRCLSQGQAVLNYMAGHRPQLQHDSVKPSYWTGVCWRLHSYAFSPNVTVITNIIFLLMKM